MRVHPYNVHIDGVVHYERYYGPNMTVCGLVWTPWDSPNAKRPVGHFTHGTMRATCLICIAEESEHPYA